MKADASEEKAEVNEEKAEFSSSENIHSIYNP